jgi:AAA domain
VIASRRGELPAVYGQMQSVLDWPANQMNAPNRLIVVTGMPCSGKSTLGTKLAGIIRCTYLDKDDFQLTIRSRWNESYMKQRESAYQCFFEVARKNLALGGAVIIDLPLPWRYEATNQAQWGGSLLRLSKTAASEPRFLLCQPPLASISQWMVQRGELRDRENMRHWAALERAYDCHNALPVEESQVRVVTTVPIDLAEVESLVEFCVGESIRR